MTENRANQNSKEGRIPLSTALRLEDLIDYAEGAVVSRTLIKNRSGTVTLFSFDKGQELSEHSTPFDALVLVLNGRAELVIGGKPVTATAGETVLMPADVPHAVKAPEAFKMILVMVRG